jgi:hypothetical protein
MALWDRSPVRALKAYAASTAALVSAKRTNKRPPDAVTATEAFRNITGDEYEPTSADLAAHAGWTVKRLPTGPAIKP